MIGMKAGSVNTIARVGAIHQMLEDDRVSRVAADQSVSSEPPQVAKARRCPFLQRGQDLFRLWDLAEVLDDGVDLGGRQVAIRVEALELGRAISSSPSSIARISLSHSLFRAILFSASA